MKQKLQFAGRIWGYYGAMMLLMLVFTMGLSNSVIRIIMDAGLIFAFLFLSFNEGGYLGEKGVTAAETIAKQEKEGRRVPDELRRFVFNRKFGALAMLICVLPFWTVSALNASYYPTYKDMEQAQTTQTEIEQAEIQQETEAAVPSDEQQAAEEEEGIIRPGHWSRVVAWVVFLPFSEINQRLSDGANAILFFLYSLILPGTALAGYLCGPYLHKKKIRQMRKSSRRKKRGLKVHKTPKAPKAEV